MQSAPFIMIKCVGLALLALSSTGLAETPADDAAAQTQGEPEEAPPEAAAETAGEAPAASESSDKAAAAATAIPADKAEAPAAAAAPPAAAAEAPGGAPTPAAVSSGSINGEAAGKPDRIAAGERVTVREGDFSVLPPTGWEVFEHLNDLTLLMQMPHQAGVKYQRTIQVASFTGPRYIDETTAKEYEDVITRKFAATSAAIEGYRIRNHMIIDMADGRPGLLFYTEFTLDAVALMQAHILVSSGGRHYLMTFTDVAEHFESEAANQFLTEAWDSMISVQLGAATPGRFTTITYGGIGIGVLLLLVIAGVTVRRIRAARAYREYADGDSDGTNLPSQPATRMSSVEPSAISHIATKQHTMHSEMADELPKKSKEKSKDKKKNSQHEDEDEAPISIQSRAAKKTSKKPETLYSEADEPFGDDDEAVG